jgi:hypothetical protein
MRSTCSFVTAANTGTLAWYHRVVRVADVLHQPAAELHRPETGEFASGVSFNTTVSVFGEVPALLAAY